MRLLFIFLDGIGLGADDPDKNPFATAEMPNLSHLLSGRRLLQSNAPFFGDQASLLALDACLGVDGRPQSASGQATLLLGKNVPQELGYHYGPKPNHEIARMLHNGNIFHQLRQMDREVAFLDAYPPGYFAAVESGRRMHAAIPLAFTNTGFALKNKQDLQNGDAIAADFTARGWREHLHLKDTPLLSPAKAGKRLAQLGQQVHFALFEYWLSDYAGHRQEMAQAKGLLETFDQVLGNLVDDWDNDKGLILITSDHGNMEDLATRKHTMNPVPCILVGAPHLRQEFSQDLRSLVDIAPAIKRFLTHPGQNPASGS